MGKRARGLARATSHTPTWGHDSHQSLSAVDFLAARLFDVDSFRNCNSALIESHDRTSPWRCQSESSKKPSASWPSRKSCCRSRPRVPLCATSRLINTPCSVPGISAVPHEDNLRYFDVTIDGPSQSPYESKSSPQAEVLLYSFRANQAFCRRRLQA